MFETTNQIFIIPSDINGGAKARLAQLLCPAAELRQAR